MTTYELLTVIISSASLIILVIGLLYGAKQIKNALVQIADTRRIHQDNHDWNRRLAAQEALRSYNYSLLSSPIQMVFNYLNVSEPIPLKNIQLEFDKDKTLQSDLHQLLNFYEGLARGIHQALFDEDVVKAARKNAMVMVEKGFLNYIENRREEVNQYAWSELSAIIGKWKNEDNHVSSRVRTDEVSNKKSKRSKKRSLD